MRGVVRRRSLRRSEEWRPAAAARTAPRGARDPVPPGFGPAADRPLRRSGATAGVAGAGPRPKIATVERREGSRSHRGMVVAPRTRDATRRVRLSALHPPLVRGAMGLLLPGLPPRLRRPLHRSLGQGRGEQDRRTRAHERAAGTKKTALFDIVSLRPWPTVRFARRDFARVVRAPTLVSRASEARPGTQELHGKVDGH